MSGICGLWHLDGKPVDPADLQRMLAPLAVLGPHGTGSWVAGPVALGHRLFHNTSEAQYETMPLTSADGTLVLTATARLDNRDELCRTLHISSAARARLPDGALILRAYEKWGEDCPQYLLGDWAFALWDGRAHTLFLARDHYGESELVYYHSDKLFAFASSLRGLLALPQVPQQPNERRLGQFLACLGWRGDESFYEGMRGLCVAQAMTVTPQGVTVRRYWHPEEVAELRLASDQEYVEAFLEVYTEAVRCRLRSSGSVGITLSGGLDSGSVAALAARELQQRGQRLTAFTWIPMCDTTRVVDAHHFGDETPFVEATRQHIGAIDVYYQRAEAVSLLAGIHRILDLTAEPRVHSNVSWIVEMLDVATAHPISTLLTGQGGNQIVSCTGRDLYLLQVAQQQRWPTLWHEYQTWRALHPGPWWRGLRSHCFNLLLPPGLRTRHAIWQAGGVAGGPCMLQPALARRLSPHLAALRHERIAAMRQGFTPGMTYRALWRQSEQWNHYGAWPMCGRGGCLEVRDPTRDARVIAYSLSLPLEQWARDGQDRWLMRRAMAGLLPDRVRWNRRRGQQATDLPWRLGTDRQALWAAYEQIKGGECFRAYVDTARLETLLTALGTRPPESFPYGAVKGILRGLAAGVFLQRFVSTPN